MPEPSRGRRRKALVLMPLCVNMIILAGAATALAVRTGTLLRSEDKPFSVGERLSYRVEWSPPWYLFFLPPMEAGEAALSLAEGTPKDAGKALKIIFTARSSGTLAKLTGITIDDRFEFTSDPDSFCTISVNKKVREGKRMRDIDYTYLPETGKLHLRELDVSLQPGKILRDRDYDGIPACVKDLFSALYDLRRNPLEVGSTSRVVVGNDQDVKEVEVHVEKKQKVSTPAGTYEAWQVNTISVIGGLFRGGGEFRIWLSADGRRMPVKFEAKVYIGKVTGWLKDAKF